MRYGFPCRREDIDRCYDLDQLKKWKSQFEQTFRQIEADYGDVDNVPDGLYRYVEANRLNLKQINFKIRKLTSDVTSVGALKCFHDVAKEMLPNEYYYIVEQAKIRLGKADADWDKLIKKPR